VDEAISPVCAGKDQEDERCDDIIPDDTQGRAECSSKTGWIPYAYLDPVFSQRRIEPSSVDGPTISRM